MRKTLVLAALAAGVLAALAAAGYAGMRMAGDVEDAGPDRRPRAHPARQAAADAEETNGPEGLREAALSLVPPIASEPPSEEDLTEKDCTAGVEERPPPCIHFFYATEGVPNAGRRRAVRDNAAQHGWRPWRRRGSPDGFIYLRRGPYRARLTTGADLPDDLVDRMPSLNEVMVFDLSRQPPPEPPPDPSGWSAEKRAFVKEVDAICARVNREARPLRPRPGKADASLVRFTEIWDDATVDLAALEPPPGDERAVGAIVREFRRFGRALRILRRVEGEMALAAVVGTFEQARRAEKAARRYGITGCSGLS